MQNVNREKTRRESTFYTTEILSHNENTGYLINIIIIFVID